MRTSDFRFQALAFAAGLSLLGLAALAQAPAQIAAPAPAACAMPAALEDGWAVATPESVGMDTASLCSIVERLTVSPMNVHAVIVVRHGKLVFEQYFAGQDQPWGYPNGRYEFKPESRHDLRSITKSVTSLLVGIAIERKLIAGVDEPVLKFFPEYAELRTAEKDRILLRHLLTMSSGIKWDENRPYTDPLNSEILMNNATDPVRFVLQQPIAIPPDQFWNYNGGGTHLLGRAVEKAAGKPLDAFAREALFDPLGITDWEWMHYRNGALAPAAGLRLRPRDVAKLGQLFLSGGKWNGRQIVSAAWLEESVMPHIGPDPYFYGYQWWLGRSLVGGREVKWSAGVGLGGQRLFIVPEYDLVVMVTAGNYSVVQQSAPPLEILNRYVFAAVRDRPR